MKPIVIVTAVFMVLLSVAGPSTVLAGPPAPRAVIPSPSFQFNPVLDGDEVSHDFAIENRGDAPLIIQNVKTG